MAGPEIPASVLRVKQIWIVFHDAVYYPSPEHQVILQLAPVAVVDQGHSRIHPLIDDFPIVGNLGAPLLGIAADQVVAFAEQFILPDHWRLGVGPHQLHPQDCHLGMGIEGLGLVGTIC